jgi:hypothetical protein
MGFNILLTWRLGVDTGPESVLEQKIESGVPADVTESEVPEVPSI